MKKTRKAWSRACRAAIASAALAASTISIAHAEDRLGIVLSASPSGAPTRTVTLGIAPEANEGTMPIFLGVTGDSPLYGVRLSATPLIDEKGVVAVAPTFDHELQTLVNDGALRRVDITVSGLKALGRFTSTLYATHGNRTQTLGTLSVVHALRKDALRVAPIAAPKAEQWFPGAPATLSLLVTVENTGDSPATIAAPVIARFTSGGKQAPAPAVRVPGGPFTIAAGGRITLRVLLDDLTRTGAFAGALRLSAEGHEPVEQTFGFQARQGPLFPAVLITLGVIAAFGIRRRLSGRAVGRTGQKRLVARLHSDLATVGAGIADMNGRESAILRTLERRLADVADELAFARVSVSSDQLIDVDQKIDLFADYLVARRHVATVRPEPLRRPFEAQLDDVARFLMDASVGDDRPARLDAFATTVREMPEAAEATVRNRFHADVDRFLKATDSGPAVAELPLRALKQIDASRSLADEGRFVEARSELAVAQRAFARLLSEELAARVPAADAAPPGFETGWPRFRSTFLDALRAVRRKSKGADAAEAYRRVWQEYAIELASRLKTAAARERRGAGGAREEQLGRVIDDCDAALARALDLEPAAVDAYRLALEGYLVPPGRRAGPRLQAALADAQLPPPLTVVAAEVADRRVTRPLPSGAESAASLTRHLRRRHLGLALLAGVAAIPAGLLLWWSPNETWGDLADGSIVFAWGFGLCALAAAADARRLGWALGRDAAKIPVREPASAARAQRVRTETEPAS